MLENDETNRRNVHPLAAKLLCRPDHQTSTRDGLHVWLLSSATGPVAKRVLSVLHGAETNIKTGPDVQLG
jgi:hypothetical protein